jgi:molybdate transport system substrate-binding protein
MVRRGSTFAGALVLVVVAACSAMPRVGGASPAQADLTIYGAASLKSVLDAVDIAYEAANPGVTLTMSTDSSAALAAQIEQGAPADVFLSADTANPRKLADHRLASGDPIAFARNTLAVIVPTANPAAIAAPADLAVPGVKVVAAGDAVPITTYADQLVANLARQPGYPADFRAAYMANVVSKEDNVKAVVARVELGEGDAAIVYRTDAEASTKVKSIDVPDDANVAAICAGVVIAGSPNVPAARRFFDWLVAADGQKIFARFGFLPRQ